MSRILGYFRMRETTQLFTPDMARDSFNSEKIALAAQAYCLAGGDSQVSSSDLKFLQKDIYCVCSGTLLNRHDLWKEFSEEIGEINSSDALLCLLLFNKYGCNFARLLNGPFCIVLLQKEEGRLWIYRDHLGQHPVFFSHLDNGYTIFSDDLAHLRSFPGRPAKVSLKSLSDFLSLGYIPSPGTIYDGISKLMPGHCLELRTDGTPPTHHQFWKPLFTPKASISFHDAVDRTRSLLKDALSRCLEAEPRSAVLLSGGIDSNVLMALCSGAKPPVNLSYTVGFQDTAYDERELAARSAAYMGCRNRQKEVVPDDWSMLHSLQKLNGEPFGDSSVIPTTVAMSLGIGEADCVITGSGGDEFFGGYRRYQALCWKRLTRWLPENLTRWIGRNIANILPAYRDTRTRLATIRRFAEFVSKSSIEGYLSFQEIFSEDMKHALLTDYKGMNVISPLTDAEKLLAMGSSTDDVEQFNELDIWEYLPEDGGTKENLASSYTGIRHLCPLLDREVAEFAMSLPSNLRVTRKFRKRMLREVGSELLLPDLLKQTKRGFGMPVSAWLRDQQSGLLRNLTNDLRHWDTQGWFRQAALQKMVDEHLRGQCDHGARLWNLLCLRAFLE